jgi:hypothetical protein
LVALHLKDENENKETTRISFALVRKFISDFPARDKRYLSVETELKGRLSQYLRQHLQQIYIKIEEGVDETRLAFHDQQWRLYRRASGPILHIFRLGLSLSR